MAARKLTPKQERFVAEYLLEPNASKAAKIAYPDTKNPDNMGHQLLGKAAVREAVDQGQARQKAELEARAKNKGITEDKWVASVAEIAFADIDTFMTMDPQSRRMSLKPVGKGEGFRPQGSGRLIRKITISPAGSVSLELHPKLPAQELLARHFGWIYDKVEHSGSINTPTASEEEMKRIMSDPEAAKLARELAEKTSKTAVKKAGGG